MFLARLSENNPALLEYAFYAHQNGLIEPDTYLLDLDVITENARTILDEAGKYGMRTYFMLKQIGRNPIVAHRLMDLGYAGAVCVDFDEAERMIENNIAIGNVGHLVQIPKHSMERILKGHPEVVTVYCKEKIEEINEAAGKLSLVQPVLIRITDEDSELYSGQIGGFHSSELAGLLDWIRTLDHVTFGGVTVFPGLLYNSEDKKIEPTVNAAALNRALAILDAKGYKDCLINVPSANCTASMAVVASLRGNNVEPGHGLTGTTPLHADTIQPERVGYVYVSEVSHNFDDKAYCFGGGHYRRGHMKNALVGKNLKDAVHTTVMAPDMDSIDYHYELDGNFTVGDTVAMCYRTQVFVERSRVAVVEGLSKGEPKILGIYDHLGRPMNP